MTQSARTHFPQETVGTIAYMAPEQIQSQPLPASDQYSLGVVVYEWLTGIRPFTGTFTELAVKHLTIPPPPLYKAIPDIPPEVEQVVLTALAKDPKQRFESVQAFAMALEQAVKTAQALANQQTMLSLRLQQQPTILASLSPSPLPAEVHPSQPTEVATPLNTPDIPYGRQSAPREEVQARNLHTPLLRPQQQDTPQMVRHQAALARRRLSRRTLVAGGITAAGIVAVGGTALFALEHYSTPATPVQTTRGTTTTSPVKTPSATRPPITPAHLAQDTFHRPDQQFWGTASDGHVWSQDVATSPDCSIAGQAGQIQRAAQGFSFYTAILGPTITDADLLVIGMISQFNGSHIGAVLRWTDNNHYYKAYIDGNRLHLLKRFSPSANPVLASIPFPAQAGTTYMLRFRVTGATLQAKAWQMGSTEPANWMLSATDTLFASGLAGLRPQIAQNVMLQITSFVLNAAAGS